MFFLYLFIYTLKRITPWYRNIRIQFTYFKMNCVGFEFTRTIRSFILLPLYFGLRHTIKKSFRLQFHAVLCCLKFGCTSFSRKWYRLTSNIYIGLLLLTYIWTIFKNDWHDLMVIIFTTHTIYIDNNIRNYSYNT